MTDTAPDGHYGRSPGSSKNGEPEKGSYGDEQHEDTYRGIFDLDGSQTVSDKFENPLAGISKRQLFKDVEKFCRDHDMMDHLETFKKGALLAQSPTTFKEMEELSQQDVENIELATTHKWKQPWMLYWLTVICGMGAATQGMDETCNNGAVAFYPDALGITGLPNETYIKGLVVGAPYLACAVLGCWLNEPMNYYLARRGTIFVSCFFATFASIWQAFTYSWPQLFAARFVLGLGIGAKSSTIPVYSAECAPAPIRGALVMQWQVWTAFGIMLGNIMGVAFYPLGEVGWRYMLASSFVPPLFVMLQVYFCPEDTFYTYVGAELESKVNKGKNFFTKFFELFTIARNRRATLASWILMIGQQFCGVNVIAYYSTTIFIEGGYTHPQALLFSMGTGVLNWIFALPAFFTIDTYGRRFLLLITFPFLCITLLWTGMSFFIPESQGTTRTAMITTGMYLYEVFYSPGMGPVPFSYSAEAFPLPVRDVGMASATAVLWAFNFILSFSWPPLVDAFKPQGAFGWYAAWCAILWVASLLVLPETKELTLEELDAVFGVRTRDQIKRGLREPGYWIQKYIFKRDVELPPLVDLNQLRGNTEKNDAIGGV